MACPLRLVGSIILLACNLGCSTCRQLPLFCEMQDDTGTIHVHPSQLNQRGNWLIYVWSHNIRSKYSDCITLCISRCPLISMSLPRLKGQEISKLGGSRILALYRVKITDPVDEWRGPLLLVLHHTSGFHGQQIAFDWCISHLSCL